MTNERKELVDALLDAGVPFASRHVNVLLAAGWLSPERVAAALALLPPDPQPDIDPETGIFWGFGKATGHTAVDVGLARGPKGDCTPDKPCPACLPDPLVVALRAALTGEGQ